MFVYLMCVCVFDVCLCICDSRMTVREIFAFARFVRQEYVLNMHDKKNDRLHGNYT